MFFSRDTAKIVQDEKSDPVKEKYGYANIYLSFVLVDLLSAQYEKLLNLTKSEETLLISHNIKELNDQLKNLPAGVEKVYILHSLAGKDTIYMAGSAITYTETVKGYGKNGDVIYNLKLQKKQEAEVEFKRTLPVAELYEEAGKTALGRLFGVGHKVCMVVDLKNKSVYYKNSYGHKIPKSVAKLLIERFSIRKSKMISDTQTQQHPEDHSNCSLLALENLIRYRDGKSSLDLSQNYIENMESIRKKYAEYLHAELEQFLTQQQNMNRLSQ